jgi:hypothetical protein
MSAWVVLHTDQAYSGVLAESFKRSHNRWLSEGIFERWWTKPKPKTTTTNTNDPKSLIAQGSCRLTVEPHVFDVKLYYLKEENVNAPKKQAPMHLPTAQYGPQNGVLVTGPLPQPTYNSNLHRSPYQPIQQPYNPAALNHGIRNTKIHNI